MALPLAAAVAIPVASAAISGMMGSKSAKEANKPRPFSQTSQTTPWDFNYDPMGSKSPGGDPSYMSQGPGAGGGEQLMGDLLNNWVGLMGRQAQGQYDPWQYASPQGRELFHGGMQDWRQGRAS